MPQGGIHILIGEDPQQHADIAEYRGDDDTLDDDQPEDAPRLGPDGLADAELMGALLDSDEHDVRHAHDAGEQGEQTYYPEGRADDADTRLHLQVLREPVPQPHSTLVLRMGLVVGVQPLPVFLLESLIGLLGGQSVEGELYTPGVVGIGTEDALDGGVGREGIGPTVLVLLVDTHHLEGEVAHIHILSDNGREFLQPVRLRTEQFLGLFVAQHDHLTALPYIDVVDEAPQHHVHLVYLGVVGVDAAE